MNKNFDEYFRDFIDNEYSGMHYYKKYEIVELKKIKIKDHDLELYLVNIAHIDSIQPIDGKYDNIKAILMKYKEKIKVFPAYNNLMNSVANSLDEFIGWYFIEEFFNPYD